MSFSSLKVYIYLNKNMDVSVAECWHHLSSFRSSHSQMFFKISVLKNFGIFTGKHLCRSLFLIKCRPESLEFVKSRAIRGIRASVVYVPMCQRANVPKASQLLIFTCQCTTNVPTCQRDKGVPIFQLGVPTRQGVPIF